MLIEKTKDVWVAWTNTDLTEGRGIDYPYCVCSSEATAIRMGKKNHVQGSNCWVTKEKAVYIGENAMRCRWLVPGRIVGPSPEDERAQKVIDSKRKIVEKAKAAGLSDEDIAALTGQ